MEFTCMDCGAEVVMMAEAGPHHPPAPLCGLCQWLRDIPADDVRTVVRDRLLADRQLGRH